MSRKHRIVICGGAFLLLTTVPVLVNLVVAGIMLWQSPLKVADGLREGHWPFREEKIVVDVRWKSVHGQDKTNELHAEAVFDGRRFRLHGRHDRGRLAVAAGDCGRLRSSIWMRTDFSSGPNQLPRTRSALADLTAPLDNLSLMERLLGTVLLHPLITGISRRDGGWRVGIHVAGGHVLLRDGWLERVSIRPAGDHRRWTVELRQHEASAQDYRLPETTPVQVSPEDLDNSLAAAVELLALQLQPVPSPESAMQREGKGWVRVRDGQRIAHFEGSAYEIGFQHGSLLAESARRVVRRTVYGVGLLYSLQKGKWFPEEARKLGVRQRAHIEDAYINEMRGLADGAGLDFAQVQAANLFPEFFHCSGAALFGRATRDGNLVHARVLDYLTYAGLQDEAVVMGVKREGVIPWINVGYAGFIGSVTGMNREHIAIGEMGGGGEGDWDGTPMSFLVRGALESCRTLPEVVDYFRTRKRTCEYYYVCSDSKIPDAVGIVATPATFEVIAAGAHHPKLTRPVPDAVLLSAGTRYQHLVERVREHYGAIDADLLFDIIDRPVSMNTNLHDAIFEPALLRTTVVNAGRRMPACENNPEVWAWHDLFPEGADR